MKVRLHSRRLATFLVLVLLSATALIVAVPSFASADEDQGYIYTITQGAATITGYTGLGGDIKIPSELGSYPVAAIGESAFEGNQLITTVTIPNGVASIGDHAFFNCNSLTSITIPRSVTNIGASPFVLCKSLTAINVDKHNANYASVDGALYDKAISTLIQCPGGKAGAFVIPSSVTAIGGSAFYSCEALTSVAIPGGVTTIDDYAFFNCNSLTSITIPRSVTNIGASAFASCSLLTAMYFDGNAPSFGFHWEGGWNSNLVVYYEVGATGFTNPWNGLPTEMIDTEAPTVLGSMEGQKYSSPGDSIVVSFYDSGVGVDASSVKVFVDGVDKTTMLSDHVSASGFTYPTALLSKGQHLFYVEVKDFSGNLATVSWHVKIGNTFKSQ